MQSERATITAGGLGFIATLTLPEINAAVSVLVGLATLGFILTRWVLFVKKSGGLRALLFAPSSPRPAPAVRRCEDCPQDRP